MFLQHCPWTDQLTSCNSYSAPAGKKTPNFLLQVSVKKTILAKHASGKEQALHVTASHQVLKVYPLMADHTIFLVCLNMVKMQLFVNSAAGAGWL